MASGDAQRTWFPEMIEMLRKEWRSSLTLEELIKLRDSLDATLQFIRRSRNILPPRIWCPHCKQYQRAGSPKVSVRATILALGRFDIANQQDIKALEKSWKKYRSENDLDLYGKKNINDSKKMEQHIH
jgi:hypothetical protein